jgi:hypothetical protein
VKWVHPKLACCGLVTEGGIKEALKKIEGARNRALEDIEEMEEMEEVLFNADTLMHMLTNLRDMDEYYVAGAESQDATTQLADEPAGGGRESPRGKGFGRWTAVLMTTGRELLTPAPGPRLDPVDASFLNCWL